MIFDVLVMDMLITCINRKSEKIPGYPAEDGLGRNCCFKQGQTNEQPSRTWPMVLLSCEITGRTARFFARTLHLAD